MLPGGARAGGEATAAGGGAGLLDELRILEIGDVAMFKQAAPARTELVWTGHHDEVEGVGRPAPFTLRRLPALRRALARGDFDLVVGHPPREAPWDPARVGRLLRRFGARGPALALGALGILLLRRVASTPLGVIDLADAAVIGRHNFPLLERARVYFKRELPANRWKVFAGSADAELPGRQRRLSPRLERWCAKLAPPLKPAWLLANVTLVRLTGASQHNASAPPLPRRQSSGSVIETSVASLPENVTLTSVAGPSVHSPPPWLVAVLFVSVEFVTVKP